jgi:hypothetical protein
VPLSPLFPVRLLPRVQQIISQPVDAPVLDQVTRMLRLFVLRETGRRTDDKKQCRAALL